MTTESNWVLACDKIKALEAERDRLRAALIRTQEIFAAHIATEQIDVGEGTVAGYPDDIAAKYGEHLGEIEETISEALKS